MDSIPLRTLVAERQRSLNVCRDDVTEPPSRWVGPASAARTAIDDDALAQRFARLTEQQQLILRYLAEGETDRMIARRAGVTPRTVTRRISEIYQELQVESRFQAGVAAHRLGLV